MKVVEFFKKVKEKCGAELGKVRPALDYVGKRKKRFIFGGIGLAIVTIMLSSAISGAMARKKRVATFNRVFKYGADDLSYNQKWAVYQCKDEDEAEAVICWIFLNEYGDTEEDIKKVKSAFARSVMNKAPCDEKLLEKWYENFLFYNHINAVEQGHYVVYLKDEGACLWWRMIYDKWLLRKYGKSMKAFSWKDSGYNKVSLF